MIVRFPLYVMVAESEGLTPICSDGSDQRRRRPRITRMRTDQVRRRVQLILLLTIFGLSVLIRASIRFDPRSFYLWSYSSSSSRPGNWLGLISSLESLGGGGMWSVLQLGFPRALRTREAGCPVRMPMQPV